MIVSWPAPAEGWLLQAATNLVTGGDVWTEIQPPYQTNGPATLSIAEPSPAGIQFGREGRTARRPGGHDLPPGDVAHEARFEA